MEPFKYTKAAITIFRLFDFDSKEKFDEILAINGMLDEKQEQCENSGLSCDTWKLDRMFIFEMIFKHIARPIEYNFDELNSLFVVILELQNRRWPLSTALIYDGVMFLANVLKIIGFETLQIPYEGGIDCFDTRSTPRKGTTIENYVKASTNSSYSGLTGPFEFTGSKRSNVAVDILNLDDNGLKKVGTFQLIPTNQTMRLIFLPKPKEEESEDIKDQLFRVVISLVCVAYSKISIILKTSFSKHPTRHQHSLGFCLNLYFSYPG